MRRSWIAALVIVLFSGAAALAQTPGPNQSSEPVVVTTGEGLVKKAPDRAFIQVTAESRAKNPRDAQKLNADIMSGVLQKLRGAGLQGDAIQTGDYDLQPEYDYNDGRQTLRGYLARNRLEVRVDDIARVGELLDLAVGAGATSVGNVRFDFKDRTSLEREALKLAVNDARQRAEAAASGAGMKVERVVRIEEQRGRYPQPPVPMMMMERAAAGAQAQPPIVPGELEIRVTVTLTSAIR